MSLIIGSSEDFMISKFEQFKINNNNLAHNLSLVASVLDHYLGDRGLDSLICEICQIITQRTGELFDADRTTIFLLNDEQNELWAIVGKDEQGCNVELRFSVTAGIAGEAATLKTVVNIPYDFYEDWPQAPEQWRASFNSNDMEFMKAFNIQAAVALQNAMLFAEVKQQEQKQKDLVRSLPHAVISTDNRGNIITANDRAMQLLGAIEIGEGVSVRDLIKLERDNFSQWLDVALSPQSDEDREQYYPDRVLCSLQGEPQKIDLWINSITDASDRNQINGVLVILSIDRHQKGL
jgi:GAF domain-containing protein